MTEFNPIMEEKIILVVDDSSITRGLIEHIYKDKYKVMMAANGQGAMDIVDVMEDSIMAILLDLNMPDVDGFDVKNTSMYSNWRRCTRNNW